MFCLMVEFHSSAQPETLRLCPGPDSAGRGRSETQVQAAAAAGAAAQYGEPGLPQWSSGTTTGAAQYS